VVLNDHWEDMRREGFISNRVFDALACGASVVSDRVSGIEDLAPGLVHTTGPDDGWQLLHDGLPTGSDPGVEERRRVAATVAADHSFAARASTLLEAALELVVSRERQTIRT
jgi:spore maturation protein CgeB